MGKKEIPSMMMGCKYLLERLLIGTEDGQRYRSMEIESIRVNTDIDPSVFTMPDKK